MIRSLSNLRSVNPGIDPHNVLTMTVSVSPKKFATPSQENAFFARLLQHLRALPGVESAAVIDSLPVTGGGSIQPVAIAGRPVVPMADQPEVAVRLISPNYVRTMRIPLLRGRHLSEADTAQSHGVALISESMARQFWPGQDAIGRHLTLTFFPQTDREVVGVTGDVKQSGLDVAQPAPTVYYPLSQASPAPSQEFRSWPMALVVRTHSETGEQQIIRSVHEVDPTAPVLDVSSMDDLLGDSLSQRKLNMLLLASFAGLALLLAATGIYSVLSYNAKRRVSEIGIRMALGASMGQVLRMMVMNGMRATLIGLAIGIAGAAVLGQVLSSLLFGVSATDVFTYVAVSLLLGSVALVASLIPAYRAARLNPLSALRGE
jgi:predicted permease